jgi:hypothetical protein
VSRLKKTKTPCCTLEQSAPTTTIPSFLITTMRMFWAIFVVVGLAFGLAVNNPDTGKTGAPDLKV